MSKAKKQEALHPGESVPKSEILRDRADDPENCWSIPSTDPTQEVASHDLASKESLDDMREHIFVTARNNEEAPVSPIVKMCWGFAALVLICLVSFVSYSLLQTQSNDASLAERIMSGDMLASLIALKEHSIQTYFTIFIIMILVLILFMTTGFGYLIYFKDAAERETHKKYGLVHVAEKAIHSNEDVIRKLREDLALQMAHISNLERDVNKYSAEIDKLSKEGDKNREKLAELIEQKAGKMAELSQARARLKAKDSSLAEAKVREEEKDKKLEDKNELIKKQSKEAAVSNKRMFSLQEELNREQSESSSLRSRAGTLQTSKTEYRSKMHQLEVEKVRLEEEIKNKRRSWWL